MALSDRGRPLRVPGPAPRWRALRRHMPAVRVRATGPVRPQSAGALSRRARSRSGSVSDGVGKEQHYEAGDHDRHERHHYKHVDHLIYLSLPRPWRRLITLRARSTLTAAERVRANLRDSPLDRCLTE